MSHAVDLETLSAVFQLTYSLTAKSRHAVGDFYYRSVASAGALYPAEIYVATGGIPQLRDGLYHFSIARHGLSLLRPGRFSLLAEGVTGTLDTRYPVFTFFITAIFFRSAWKYRERSYRYHLLDAGHLAENLVLALNSLGLSNTLMPDFDDDAVNRLIGVDPEREVCLTLCRTSRTTSDGEVVGELGDMDRSIPDASRVSDREIDYPLLRDIHLAGTSVAHPAEHRAPMASLLGPIPPEWRPLDVADPWPETLTYPEVVAARRSRRNFVQQPISRACLAALLDGLCSGRPGDSTAGSHVGESSTAIGLLIGRVEGWDSGYYLFDPESRTYGWIDPEQSLDRMARICLDQMWMAHAAVQILFLSDLGSVDRTWGPRGYRYAMMTAGRLGERLYLMATAMGLGCCGIGAFYDAEAVNLLRLHAASRLLYLVAVGPTR